MFFTHLLYIPVCNLQLFKPGYSKHNCSKLMLAAESFSFPLSLKCIINWMDWQLDITMFYCATVQLIKTACCMILLVMLNWKQNSKLLRIVDWGKTIWKTSNVIKRCYVLIFFLFRMRILGLFLTSPKHFISYQRFSTRQFQTLVSSTWLRNQLAAARELSSQLRVLDASWQSNGQGYEQLYKQWEYSYKYYTCTGKLSKL